MKAKCIDEMKINENHVLLNRKNMSHIARSSGPGAQSFCDKMTPVLHHGEDLQSMQGT